MLDPLRDIARRVAGRLEGAKPGNRRADYAQVWDSLATTEDSAKIHVAGYTDEDLFRRTAEVTVQRLRDTVGISEQDTVLEIGAGVGRLGAVIAPLCDRWIGTDVSGRMLSFAGRRLREHDNVDLVRINGYDLAAIPTDSIDVVYCVVVFMHLEEWDRYGYVLEAARVLRPGGRIFIDNFNLCGDRGWDLFEEHRLSYRPIERPPHISRSSTPDELRCYLQRAGFADIGVEEYDGLWVAAHGWLPGA